VFFNFLADDKHKEASLKLQYIISAILVAAISITPSIVRAEMPSEIRQCLAPNPLYTTPKQYRQFAQINDGRATYYYLHAIFKPSQVPDTVALIKVENGQCKSLGQPLSMFENIGKYVPSNVAIALTEAKWRSVQKMKGGAQFIKSFLNPGDERDPQSGEILGSVQLAAVDRIALKKIGAYRR
jgi:hypothetical protein